MPQGFASRWAQAGEESGLVDNLNRFGNGCADRMMRSWRELDHLLLMRYMDGNVKTVEDGSMRITPTGVLTGMKQPPYPAWFYRQMVDGHGDVLKSRD